MMRKILPVVMMAIALLSACGDSYQTKRRLSAAERARTDSIDKAALKIAVLPTLDCMPLYVARSTGLFDTLGVEVHLKPFAAQMDCDTALERHRVEGTVTDLVRVARLQQQGMRLLLPVATNAYWQLITNRNARIRELRQMSDKMVAITRYSATDMLSSLAIDSAKPKYSVFRVQINDVKVRLAMLLNNEIDAVMLTEPQATVARIHGNPVLMDSRSKDLHLGVIAFDADAVSHPRRKRQLQLFLKAYNQACDSLNKLGTSHYAEILEQFLGADAKTIKALPHLTYPHAQPPRQHDINKANIKWN